MNFYALEILGDSILHTIKSAIWFPFKTGRLKFHATSGRMVSMDTYRIQFSSSIAPYVEYLEEGTRPHDIPRAFGRPLPFGIGGRFDGKFHSGSTKHVGFIKDKSVNAVIDFITRRYGGTVIVE